MSEGVSNRGRERKKPVTETVNLTEGLPWQGEAKECDPNEDAWQTSAPPPAGVYEVELAVFSSELVKYDPEDEKTWSYVINIEGRVTNKHPEVEGANNFLRVSTYRKRGAKISTAEGALLKLGVAKDKLAAQKLTPQQVAKSLGKLLANGPITLWETDWTAGYEDADGKWHTVCSTYDDFPNDPEGGKQHAFRVTVGKGQTEEISAKSRVIRWIGKGEDSKPSRKSKEIANAAVASALDVDLGEDVKPNGKAATPIRASQTKAQPVEPENIEDQLDLS